MTHERRFAICEGYAVFAMLWHRGGWTERCHQQGRNIDDQLHRMRFKLSPLISGPRDLEPEAREVYDTLAERYHGVKPMRKILDEWALLFASPSPGCEECGLGHMDEVDDDPDAYEAALDGVSFTWSPCHLCGNRLGGDRQYAHGMVNLDDTEWTHLEICRDCFDDLAGC